MAANPGDLWDYVVGGTGKGMPLVNKPLPVVTIATTSGTGSEINCWGVISNPDTREKIGFGGTDDLCPVLSVVDPELMATVPAMYTAYQGFDALFHNTEVMISKGVNLLSETLALSAIEHIARYLPQAVCKGDRSRGPGACRLRQHHRRHDDAADQHHRGAFHGARDERFPSRPASRRGLIMISRAFYAFFIQKHACDKQFIKMARAMGIPDADKPEDFLTALTRLQQDCGVADLKMSDYGITPDEFLPLAVNARETMGGLFLANPCPMSDEECAGIFREAYR